MDKNFMQEHKTLMKGILAFYMFGIFVLSAIVTTAIIANNLTVAGVLGFMDVICIYTFYITYKDWESIQR